MEPHLSTQHYQNIIIVLSSVIVIVVFVVMILYVLWNKKFQKFQQFQQREEEYQLITKSLQRADVDKKNRMIQLMNWTSIINTRSDSRQKISQEMARLGDVDLFIEHEDMKERFLILKLIYITLLERDVQVFSENTSFEELMDCNVSLVDIPAAFCARNTTFKKLIAVIIEKKLKEVHHHQEEREKVLQKIHNWDKKHVWYQVTGEV